MNTITDILCHYTQLLSIHINIIKPRTVSYKSNQTLKDQTYNLYLKILKKYFLEHISIRLHALLGYV